MYLLQNMTFTARQGPRIHSFGSTYEHAWKMECLAYDYMHVVFSYSVDNSKTNTKRLLLLLLWCRILEVVSMVTLNFPSRRPSWLSIDFILYNIKDFYILKNGDSPGRFPRQCLARSQGITRKIFPALQRVVFAQ
ncbi:hypothetical protein BofuT4_P160170.1 [Botrytis cinerea T4]|uniref:Uncharacterized protein n=1 Tax=Botryotinia fuckeliana (strain T4) TaxID=999810 RepID=G2YTG8_BOTF4|nr:hypothetical protein BofuT4_P160170.1 [Botrytis cinerea T4]